MKFSPHSYQVTAIDWIKENPRCGLFLDMGLGKTVTTLTALNDLMYDSFEVSRALVIAPKRVVTDTWALEAKKWDHLRHLRVVPIVGTPSQRKRLIEAEADIYLISRDNIKWLIEYRGTLWDYDALVIDELSSFKSPSAARFKALKKVVAKCDRVIGLTGTPAPNGYTDLWSEMYLIDNGERLGKTVTDFRRRYCVAHPFPSFTTYEVPPENTNAINAKISDICVSMTAKDYLYLPAVSYINKPVILSPGALKAYEAMKKEAVLELDPEKPIIGVTAAAVMNKLLQICNGYIYNDDLAEPIHHDKLDALEELIESAQGQPVLLFYPFKFDVEAIKSRFPYAETLDSPDALTRWNKGEIKLLLAHPASCGHGLNLQAGGSIIVWYGLTWSLELYQQANARLNRQGQKKPVMIYHLIAAGTVEERVLKALDNKSTTQKALMDCVKAELEGVKA